MRTQCRRCPWRVGVDPNTIPHGYDRRKHEALRETIAVPGAVAAGPVRLMACHHSPRGAEKPCVGWLVNQMGDGNNIPLRLLVRDGRVDADVRTVGPQHRRFEDTLPPEEGA